MPSAGTKLSDLSPLLYHTNRLQELYYKTLKKYYFRAPYIPYVCFCNNQLLTCYAHN